MRIDIIEFPTRAALVAALIELRGTDGVEQIDIVGNGKTLRVVNTVEGDEQPPEPEGDQEGSGAVLEPPAVEGGTEAPPEPVEVVSEAPEPAEDDLIGGALVPTKKGKR